MLSGMARRLLLLIGVLAVPVGVALGSQWLSHSVEPPELPAHELETGSQEGR